LPTPVINTITERHRQRLDLEARALRLTRNRVQEHIAGDWHRELCVKRLAGEISETEWQIALQRAEKAHHKERAWLQLMEMYVITTSDILWRLATETAPDLSDILAQHDRLLEFSRDQSVAISKAYQCVFLKLTPNMGLPVVKPVRAKKVVVATAAKAASNTAAAVAAVTAVVSVAVAAVAAVAAVTAVAVGGAGGAGDVYT
jgi:hypothetical protein